MGGLCGRPKTIACLPVEGRSREFTDEEARTRHEIPQMEYFTCRNNYIVTNDRSDSYRRNAILMNLKNYSQ